MDLRETVLDCLRQLHLDVFPLNGKIPVCNWKDSHDVKIQENQNFGVKLGNESNIFVIDVDDYSLLSYFEQFLKKTYVVKTGRGFHIYIKADNLPPDHEAK